MMILRRHAEVLEVRVTIHMPVMIPMPAMVEALPGMEAEKVVERAANIATI
jgi:hypothetical protein